MTKTEKAVLRIQTNVLTYGMVRLYLFLIDLASRITKLIEKDYENMDALSELILNSALKKKCNRAIDDMTVTAIKINFCE